jgi:hypothetical protein
VGGREVERARQTDGQRNKHGAVWILNSRPLWWVEGVFVQIERVNSKLVMLFKKGGIEFNSKNPIFITTETRDETLTMMRICSLEN